MRGEMQGRMLGQDYSQLLSSNQCNTLKFLLRTDLGRVKLRACPRKRTYVLDGQLLMKCALILDQTHPSDPFTKYQ